VTSSLATVDAVVVRHILIGSATLAGRVYLVADNGGIGLKHLNDMLAIGADSLKANLIHYTNDLSHSTIPTVLYLVGCHFNLSFYLLLL